MRAKKAMRWMCAAWLMAAPAAGWAAGQEAKAESSAAAALRDALRSACEQDPAEFAKELTVRNAEAFARMTPAARVTLLKRFALLDKAGKATTTRDTNGNYVVKCVTQDVTTEMKIGGGEARDNMAFLTLTVSEASEGAAGEAHKVQMGMVKENGQWKLLSLGLLLLDLPTLGAEWDRAEMGTNEKAALATMKTLIEAIETYRKTYTRLPETLQALGPAQGAPKSDQAGLLDATLAAGRKDGYTFRYAIVGANSIGAPAKYELVAIPQEYGRSGGKSYFRDTDGEIHAGDHQGGIATASDPKVE